MGQIKTIVTVSFETPSYWNELTNNEKLALSECASLDVTLSLEPDYSFNVFDLKQWDLKEKSNKELTKTYKIAA
jgi:hypothetical protein